MMFENKMIDYPTLSICIPTYNRAGYLAELLESIVTQLGGFEDRVEICVSDNASTDNTDEIIQQFSARCSNLIYHKNIQNFGPDENFLQCVRIASGEYAWIIGSDDKLCEGALREIFILLSQATPAADILLFREKTWYYGTVIEPAPSYFKKEVPSMIFDANDSDQWVAYCQNMTRISGLLGYLSTTIFNRKKWVTQLQGYEHFIGTGYVHLYLLMQMIIQLTPCFLMYVNQAMVLSRTNNDSFLAQSDRLKRILLDIDGYTLVSQLFPDEKRRTAVIAVLYRQLHHTLYYPFLIYDATNSRLATIKEVINVFKMRDVLKQQYAVLNILFISYHVPGMQLVMKFILNQVKYIRCYLRMRKKPRF